MKLDNEKVAHTPDSKSLKNNNNNNNNDITEIANETKIEVFPEPNGHETNNDGFWPMSDFDGPESPDKLQKGDKIVDDTKLLDEFSVFTDKNVTNCKVSEAVITPSETQQQLDLHEVKEIHIDKTAPEHNASVVPEKEVSTTIATNELPYSIKLEEEKGVSGINDVDNLSANPKSNHVSDSRAGSDRDFYGESSFSMAGPMSGLIAYSGSLSLRSESSTTSTRSFAFPIMQNEWNSSPVRMAKADRSRLRKQKGWRQGILCCRF